MNLWSTFLLGVLVLLWSMAEGLGELRNEEPKDYQSDAWLQLDKLMSKVDFSHLLAKHSMP